MSTKKTLRNIELLAEKHGLKSSRRPQNGHIKMDFEAPDGRTRMMVIPVSTKNEGSLLQKVEHRLKTFAAGGDL